VKHYYTKVISTGKDMAISNLYCKQKAKFVDEVTKLTKAGAQVRLQTKETAQQWFPKCFCSVGENPPVPAPDWSPLSRLTLPKH